MLYFALRFSSTYSSLKNNGCLSKVLYDEKKFEYHSYNIWEINNYNEKDEKIHYIFTRFSPHVSSWTKIPLWKKNVTMFSYTFIIY